MCVWADDFVADVVRGAAGVFCTAFVVQSRDISNNRVYPLPFETHSLTCLQLFKTTTFRGPSFSPKIEPYVLDHSWNLLHQYVIHSTHNLLTC